MTLDDIMSVTEGEEEGRQEEKQEENANQEPFEKEKFQEILDLTQQHKEGAIRKLLISLETDVIQSFFDVKGKHGLSLLFETLIYTAREKDNILHRDLRGPLCCYQPSASTQNTRCWRILRLFLYHGLSHHLDYLTGMELLQLKWDTSWDLVLEELWCLLISNCVVYGNVLDTTPFPYDIVKLVHIYLGWNFPSNDFLSKEYGWLFPE